MSTGKAQFILKLFVVVGTMASVARAGGPPDPVGPGAADPRARYLSITPPTSDSVGGEPLAIRVEIISMDRFPEFEGEIRWVGMPADYPLTRIPYGGTFKAAPLECDPVYLDWGSVGVLEVFGSEVVPSHSRTTPDSVYEIRTATADCVALGTLECMSMPVQVAAGLLGDATAPFGGVAQPQFADANAIADAFNGAGSGYQTSKPLAQQAPNLLSPIDPITMLDFRYYVLGFNRFSFPDPPPLICPRPFVGCGDGRTDPPEECDDGNLISGDGCDDFCRLENATLTVSLVPAQPPEAPLVEPYPVGTIIDGDEITVPGGVRVFFELYLADWDPDLDMIPRLGGMQVTLDASQLTPDDRGWVVPATPPCEQFSDVCEDQGLNVSCQSYNTESYCPAGLSELGFDLNVFDSSIVSVRFADDVVFSGFPLADSGEPVLAGRVAFDVATDAFGTYEIGIVDEYPNTFFYDVDGDNGLPIPIGVAELHGATITIQNEKSRYLTTPVPQASVAGADPVAVRVELVDSALFPGSIGQVRWAGAPSTVADGSNSISIAPLQCEPNVQSWDGATLLHLFGVEVVPESTYESRTATADCIALGTVDCMSDPFVVSTSQWGDAVGPWGGPNQPNFADITGMVDKFKDVASAPSLTRTDLVPDVPNQVTNFADISAGVEAFKGVSYPFAGPATCP